MEPVVPKVPRKIGVEGHSRRMKQPKSLLWLYLGKKKGGRKKKKLKSISEKKIKIMKDDIRCLDGLETERQSMQN